MRIVKKSFGKLPDGREADLYILTNNTGASVEITNYGGIIRALHVAAGLAELHGIWDIKVENGRLFVFVMDGEHIRSNEGGV